MTDQSKVSGNLSFFNLTNTDYRYYNTHDPQLLLPWRKALSLCLQSVMCSFSSPTQQHEATEEEGRLWSSGNSCLLLKCILGVVVLHRSKYFLWGFWRNIALKLIKTEQSWKACVFNRFEKSKNKTTYKLIKLKRLKMGDGSWFYGLADLGL